MTTIGIVTFIGLSLIGVRLAAVLAFFAFLMELLPLIGPWIAVIPALIIALTQGTFLEKPKEPVPPGTPTKIGRFQVQVGGGD